MSQGSCPTLADFVDKFTQNIDFCKEFKGGNKGKNFIKCSYIKYIRKSNCPSQYSRRKFSIVQGKYSKWFSRGFNSLNQGNPQKPQNQEAYCKYHKSTKHSSADCRNKTINQNNSSGKNNQNNNPDMIRKSQESLFDFFSFFLNFIS